MTTDAGRFARVAIVIVIAAGIAAGCGGGGPAVLQVGDCIADPPAFVGDSADVRAVACDQPHGGEVFFVEDYPEGGEYPGDPAFQDYVGDRCIAAYATYTGEDMMIQDEMDLGWLQPSEADWNAGGRRIVCFATPFETGKKTTGSIRRP